jgi:hypothetical protein
MKTKTNPMKNKTEHALVYENKNESDEKQNRACGRTGVAVAVQLIHLRQDVVPPLDQIHPFRSLHPPEEMRVQELVQRRLGVASKIHPELVQPHAVGHLRLGLPLGFSEHTSAERSVMCVCVCMASEVKLRAWFSQSSLLSCVSRL